MSDFEEDDSESSGEDFSASEDEWLPEEHTAPSSASPFIRGGQERSKVKQKPVFTFKSKPKTRTNRKKTKHVDSDDSSSSSGDDYLVDPTKLDLGSSFFEPSTSNAGANKREQPPQFDCNAGLGQLSDSDDDDEDDSNFQDVPATSHPSKSHQTTKTHVNLNKNELFMLNLEKAKEHLINFKSDNFGKDDVGDDVGQLLAMGEKSAALPSSTTSSSAKAEKRKFVGKTKKIKAADSGSDWEEVTEKKAKTAAEDVVIEVRPTIKQKKDRNQLEMEAQIKRMINRKLKESQIVMHKTHILCWIAHGNHVNTVLNHPKLMQLSLAFMPSKYTYPKDRTDLSYFEQITKWYANQMQLKDERVHSPLTRLPPLVISLALQIQSKAAICKKTFVLMFVVLLRAIGVQCRLVMNLVTLPMRPPSSELCTIALKPETKNNDTKKSSTSNNNKNKSSKIDSKSIKKEVATKLSKIEETAKSSKSSHKKDVEKLEKHSDNSRINSKLLANAEKSPEIKKSSSSTSSNRRGSIEKSGRSSKSSSQTTLKSETKVSKAESSTVIANKLKKNTTSAAAAAAEKSTPKKSINNISPHFPKTKSSQSSPTKSTSAPTKSTSVPTKSTSASTKSISAPTKSKVASTKSTSVPTKSTSAPTKPKAASTKSTSAPTKSTSAPTKTTSSSSNPIQTDKSKVRRKTSTNVAAVVESPHFNKTVSPNSSQSTQRNSNNNNTNTNTKTQAKHSVNVMVSPRRTRSRSQTGQKINNPPKIPQLDGNDDDNVIKSSRKRPNLERLKTAKVLKKAPPKARHHSNSSEYSEDSDDSDYTSPPPKKKSVVKPLVNAKVAQLKQESKSRLDRRVLSTDDDEKKPHEVETKKNSKAMDVWVEVYSERDDRWMAVDLFKQKIDNVEAIRQNLTKPFSYVLAWNNDNSIKDVSSRYCVNWNTVTRKQRVEQTWLDQTLLAYRETPNFRTRAEDLELNKIHIKEPLPKTIGEFKDHPLYALQRHLLKFQGIYPPDAPTLGFIRGEPIYSRDCVHLLHSREVWLKSARVVKPGQTPYKIVKARPKWNRQTNTCDAPLPLEIFGIWQTQPYEPPTAENGIVPRNAYGNVELFLPEMLPKKTVHLQLPGLNRTCKKLNIDCANAMVGFDFHSGYSHAVYDGYVICEEFAEKAVAQYWLDQEEAQRREEEKLKARVYGNWKKLIKGLLIRERLQRKYNFSQPADGEEEEATEATTAAATASKQPSKSTKKTRK